MRGLKRQAICQDGSATIKRQTPDAQPEFHTPQENSFVREGCWVPAGCGDDARGNLLANE
jgi:hypothetical protein